MYGLYNKLAPFLNELIFCPETKNNRQFYILKLFFSSHDNQFSCPVTSFPSKKNYMGHICQNYM